MLRQQLFHRWSYYFERDDFAKVDNMIRDSQGEVYPVTLIIKHRNPHRAEIFEAFMRVTDGYKFGK